MKKILITGLDSYIGASFKKWCIQSSGNYDVSVLDMKGEAWRQEQLSEYDSIFHVAGIAHAYYKEKSRELYYSVNCELAYETALKAKNDGVKQFVFMSSMKVYSDTEEFISSETKPFPDTVYGDSKLQAEMKLKRLESDEFKVVIIRSPMIYGDNKKGNYSRLVNLAKKLPVFPKFENQRSMLHVDNLCEFVRLMIQNEENGTFFPQNREYVTTYEMVRMIRLNYGKNLILTRMFNRFIPNLIKVNSSIRKLFANLVYEKKLSEYKEDYCVRDFKQSINI